MNYICVNAACKMSATCAHAIEYNKVAKEQEIITALNPKSQNFDEEGKCQYYHALQNVVYAYGFVNWMNTLSHPDYQAFTKALIVAFNRTDFYAMRSGRKAISPERQQQIIDIASSIGCILPANAWDKIAEVME